MKILEGDSLTILPTIPDNSIDAIVTDPPYGLKFMGRQWDYELPSIDIWRECLRVLKPGGHLACFGGSRTHHRVWCAIEDAGFELRDTCMWLHGQGFPKSKDVACAIDKYMGHPNRGRAIPVASSFQVNETPLTSNDVPPYEAKSAEARKWQGWGSALKPSHEPILIARKPLEGNIAQNVLAHGTGGINVDASRVGTDETWQSKASGEIERIYSHENTRNSASGADSMMRFRTDSQSHPAGRWPSNILLDGSDEVTECFPQSKSSGSGKERKNNGGESWKNSCATIIPNSYLPPDEGSAARFYPHLGHGENELKPDHEPILIARKPLEGTIAENVLAHGTGGLNIDACRVGTDVIQSNHTAAMSFNGVNHRPYHEDHVTTSHTHTGRWPSNILLDGSDEVTECFPKSKSCDTPSNARSVSPIFGERKQGTIYPGEDGSASRYFSSLEYSEDERRVRYCAKASKRDRAGSKHPTVKPIKLLEWLCTLICPPGGTILDPFAGSGTTGAAARNCGFDFILIEREAEYVEDINRRFAPDPLMRVP